MCVRVRGVRVNVRVVSVRVRACACAHCVPPLGKARTRRRDASAAVESHRLCHDATFTVASDGARLRTRHAQGSWDATGLGAAAVPRRHVEANAVLERVDWPRPFFD